MATSSKFIQLSSSVLMEYVYSDQSQINVAGNPYRISTSTAPIWKTQNLHNNQDQILNSDSSEVIVDGSPIGTGNCRNRSFGIIQPYQIATLDINKITFYNDYDPDFTPTTNLPITFNNPQAPVYDTIRLHLVQGFNFEQNQALIMSVKALKKDGTTFILDNLFYGIENTWETMNPSPFFYGGRVYNSYLEVRVLSVYNLIYDYWYGVLTGDTVAERITNFVGIKQDQNISIYFSFANNKQVIDGQTYYNLTGTVSVDIPPRDQFEGIAAYIGELNSQNGDSMDCIEYYATYGGSIIYQYINDLNSSGYNFILLHDLIVSEYVYDPSNNTYSWIQTDQLELTQTTNFDEPNYYRPIIRNPGAIAFQINYTAKMYNQNDNSQVIKTANLVSYSASKYGEILRSINLGVNPVQTKVYNQQIVKSINFSSPPSTPSVNSTTYITSLSTNANISVTAENIAPGATGATASTLVNATLPNTGSGTSNVQVFGNGLGRIMIPESSVFIKFTLFQSNNGVNTQMNLTGIGNIVLAFTSQNGDQVLFKSYPNTTVSPSTGEVVFYLTQKQAKQVLGYTNRNFQLFLQNNNDMTFMYIGQFYSASEYQQISTTNRIAQLESQVTSLSSNINYLNSLTVTQQNTISNITASNNKFQQAFNSINSAAQKALTMITTPNQAQAIIDQANQAIIDEQQKTMAELKTHLDNLSSTTLGISTSLNSAVSALAAANGLSHTIIPSTTESTTPTTQEAQSATEIKLAPNQASVKNTNASNMNPGTS